MTVVYKYQLDPAPGSHTGVHMPRGARIIYVGEQQGVPTIWAEVDPSQERARRSFCTVGTGWHGVIQPGWSHVGTYRHDVFMWHVYETTGEVSA